MPRSIKVSLPAQPQYIHILRSVVASAAASADFTIDAIDDLRLVLDEACGQVLGLSEDADQLILSVGFGDGALELTVSTDGSAAELKERPEDSMAWTILSALADDLHLEQGDSPAIRLSKNSRRS